MTLQIISHREEEIFKAPPNNYQLSGVYIVKFFVKVHNGRLRMHNLIIGLAMNYN